MTAITHEQANEVLQQADLLHSAADIQSRIASLAGQINQQFAGKDTVIFCVMNGGILFAGMLMPLLNFAFHFDYLHASRYREKTTGGDDIHWIKHNAVTIKNRHVLVIDDILDEGYTLEAIVNNLAAQSPASLMTAVLAEKKHARGNGFNADFVGLQLIDRYVFGMGMDYCGYLRHLPAIYAVKGL